MIIPERYVADARSGERLCVYDTTDIEDIASRTSGHSLHDVFEGFCVCQHMIIRTVRLYGKNSQEQFIMERMAVFYLGKMDREFFWQEMTSLCLVTFIDLREHGKRLCRPFLRE